MRALMGFHNLRANFRVNLAGDPPLLSVLPAHPRRGEQERSKASAQVQSAAPTHGGANLAVKTYAPRT